MNSSGQEPEVIVSRSGSLGRISLNRPKALNALTLGMVQRIEAALDEFETAGDIAAVLLTGEGERGLCAGGDIRAIHESGRAGTPLAETFWREEYHLNARIGRYPKPYIAFMDGIVMGGGVGLSAHGRFRLVTETTRLAMPETGIGFFPDVGATWLLSRPGSEKGTYLGLTGVPVGAADAIGAGLADYCLPRDRLDALAERLSGLSPEADTTNAVREIISALEVDAGIAFLEAQGSLIDRTFGHDTIEAILAALASEDDPFAAETRKLLLTKSPTSLAVTLRLLRLGRKSATLETCLAREFAATPAVLASHDFYEGVRAAVIDKDRNPRWYPPTIDAVDAGAVEGYFREHPHPLF